MSNFTPLGALICRFLETEKASPEQGTTPRSMYGTFMIAGSLRAAVFTEDGYARVSASFSVMETSQKTYDLVYKYLIESGQVFLAEAMRCDENGMMYLASDTIIPTISKSVANDALGWLLKYAKRDIERLDMTVRLIASGRTGKTVDQMVQMLSSPAGNA